MSFLKFLRDKETEVKGSSMCLNDFEEFAKAHSAVPEDEDEMFVKKGKRI